MSAKRQLNLLQYLRKSREDQAAEARGEGDTLAKHRRALATYVKQHGHKVIGVFEEVVSGERIVDRPEMQKLLHAMNEGTYNGKVVDGVICIDEHRLGRGNMIDQGIIQDTFKSNKMILVTPRKVYDPESELDEEWFEFESFMARREFKMISRRLKRGKLQSAAEGQHMGGRPFGYLKIGRTLTPHPEEAKIVQLIFELAAVEGLGKMRIANKLTDMGVPAQRGGQWAETTIQGILINEVYLGHTIYGKRRYEKKDTGGYRIINVKDKSLWIIKENAHEPLVSLETFTKAKAALKQRTAPRIKRGTQIANPLAGLAKCKDCGYSLSLTRAPNKNVNRLVCRRHGCKNMSGDLFLVENRLIQTLRQYLSGFELELKHHQIKLQPMREVLEERISFLEKQKADLSKQSDTIHDLLEQGVYSVDKFKERNKDLQSRIEKTDEDHRTCSSELQLINEKEFKKKEVLPKLVNVLDVYDTLSAEDRNRLLKTIVERTEYKREKKTRVDEFSLEVFLHF